MNILIFYGAYMIICGFLGAAFDWITDFLNWQTTSSVLNILHGMSAAMFLIGVLAIICGVYLGMISKSAPEPKPPIMFFIGSLLGAVLSMGLMLFSLYLEQPSVNGHTLFIVGCRFISIIGLFASPLCLIEGYLLKIKKGGAERSDEADI